MKKIAFYGKGGIGKSTIAANISALYSAEGGKVLHIGCDPKADSTRLLMRRRIPTVLEQLEKLNDGLTEGDILFEGKYGVWCAEAGVPQAGMGCAGLGITSAVNELERLGIMSGSWDMIVYDVLGDVVCGGFSVPMRKHYADQIYIVTSADYMSLYAANNILKGCRHYSGKDRNLAAGLILNHIKNDQEMMIGCRFADRTGIPVAACLRESSEMQAADYKNALFTEVFPEGENAMEIRFLLQRILEYNEETDTGYRSYGEQEIHPMDEMQMEGFRKEILYDYKM